MVSQTDGALLTRSLKLYYIIKNQMINVMHPKGPLPKGLSLLIPHFKSSYPCTKPISFVHQTFLIPCCHKMSPRFVRGVAQSASSRLNVGVDLWYGCALSLVMLELGVLTGWN